jgi:hypothetical protein
MSILFPVLTPVAGSFCAAPGEPLRGTAVTHEGSRQVAYLIGATSHRASKLAVLVPLDLSRAQIEAAQRACLNRIMPGQGDRPEALDRLWALLGTCAAEGRAGDVLDVQLGATRMSLGLTQATRESLGLVPSLLDSARSQLLALGGAPS